MSSLNVLITGGASGIGLGIAEHLASLGHYIVLADIHAEQVENAAKGLRDKGYQCSAVDFDASDAKQIAALPERLAPRQIQVLINNAGIQHVAKLEDFPPEKWQQLINLMLVGPALLTQVFLPAMKANNFGRIINVGSIHSLVASPYKSAYVAAKHGLLGFSKTLALELGEFDITVNTLCPSYVKTPLVEKQIAAQARENKMTEEDVVRKIMLEPMPKKAFIGLDELAGTAAFLLSSAARNICGQTMVLDGGWVAR
ncbi:3-hydroxybutyrate dehydrogenase [Aliiglaciecola sp. CAU 1673]|uniref:3-hydroxybutyrate dehydrogenase n=1 Tax=Aliiglaciecola sp. CAU 1673 TaxID=3032595 RepID=UPI0023DB6865|nr:3-hydroxybutyrate dehydrogenase [Aliiglaciecola sp. CAU 1673]MDF2179963.1 3-hydroxybutyrate dehydrogenase [Aliiglaciecola sp. CAU 1673]